MLYEVFIPSKDDDEFDVTVRVEAKNWTQALKTGLDRTGEAMVRNVMADIKSDNSIHVTDATSQRVFVIRELDEEQQQKAAKEKEKKAAKEKPKAKSKQKPPAQQRQPKAEAKSKQKPPAQQRQPKSEAKSKQKPPAQQRQPKAKPKPEQKRTPSRSQSAESKPAKKQGDMEVGSSTFEALQEVDDEKHSAQVVSEKRHETSEQSAVGIGRPDEAEEAEKVSETLIEDVFLEIQAIHEGNRSMEEVVDMVMDMVVDKLNAESGAVLFADVSGRELYFATARGPKADEVMDFRVPMGEGIVGFCAREGVSLAISDAQEDPRFYKEISESLGYETRSLACSPIQHEGRVYGAIEVINKQGGSTFSGQEISAMAYIGRQTAQFVHDLIMEQEKLGS